MYVGKKIKRKHRVTTANTYTHSPLLVEQSGIARVCRRFFESENYRLIPRCFLGYLHQEHHGDGAPSVSFPHTFVSVDMPVLSILWIPMQLTYEKSYSMSRSLVGAGGWEERPL